MATVAQDARPRGRRKSGGLRDEWTKIRRRRTYLIDARTQFTITRQFLVVLLAASGLSIGNYHVFRSVLSAEIYDSVDAWMAYGYCLIMVAVSVVTSRRRNLSVFASTGPGASSIVSNPCHIPDPGRSARAS